jgi:hypothetical protein
MSAVLADYFADREKVFVFANTSKERPETLDFVNKCDQWMKLNVVWVEAVINPEHGKGTRHKVVSFDAAKRKGEVFEAMIKKYGIPNQAFPHCTRELKRHAIHSYVKNELSWADYETAIGIRADEAHRINRKEAIRQQWIYPLTDLIPITKPMVNKWWSRQPFRLELKEHEGNCDFCWKKSEKKLVRLTRENPCGLDWWQKMEARYSSEQSLHRSLKLEPSYFFRGNMSAKELREITEKVSRQADLFESLSELETDCFCKST